jgi:hypothetical protein
MPAGLAEVERAKKDGRWDRAYESQSSASLPEDLAKALANYYPTGTLAFCMGVARIAPVGTGAAREVDRSRYRGGRSRGNADPFGSRT